MNLKLSQVTLLFKPSKKIKLEGEKLILFSFPQEIQIPETHGYSYLSSPDDNNRWIT